jgi:hypothetical protein
VTTNPPEVVEDPEVAGTICGEPDPADFPEPPAADTSGEPITVTAHPDDVELDSIDHALLAAQAMNGGGHLLVSATTLTKAQATAILVALGWRIRSAGEYVQAVRHFQAGWMLGAAALAVDGKVGPITSAALRVSNDRRTRAQPTASAHFSFADLACRCGGKYSDCPRIWVIRPLLASLETLRVKAYPRGMRIVSGCRCVHHNTDVQGAPTSQHLYGGAADLDYVVSDDAVRGMRLFAGIGRSKSTHLVRHVDRRDATGVNPTHGSLVVPTLWDYAA